MLRNVLRVENTKPEVQLFPLEAARILIVDDEELNVSLLDRILKRAGFSHVRSTTDSRDAIRLIEEFRPDLILLDLQMPYVTGLSVLKEVRARIPESTYLPVLVLTADASPQTRHRALEAGAKDFLTKPFDISEVVLRVRNLLETRRLHVQLQQEKSLLEERVRERTRDLEGAQLEVLRRLAHAAEFRDDETGQHTHRVGGISALIGGAMGMAEQEIELLGLAAPLHDVGKIGIPDAILLKPGRLTPEELAVMRTHTVIGAKLLAGGKSASVRLAEQIAVAHHERWDGSGYPRGLVAEQIPIEARIVALADFYDALSHDRPYRKAWADTEITLEIERQAGRHFDPAVVEAFAAVKRDMEPIGTPGVAD